MSNIKPLLYYCYDAYCGWCYGFSPVIRKIYEHYQDKLDFDVLSGGMIIGDQPLHISALAPMIQEAYKTVESYTGVTFGSDYLWHIMNPEESDWYPFSEKPAIALCIFKEYHPDRSIEFAVDLQIALNYEGRDLCDNEAYRHLLDKYEIPHEPFYQKLKTEAYREKAYYEFALIKQLQITGFPSVIVQVSESKFHLIGRGYTDFSTLAGRIDQLLEDLKRIK
jgi:putative protein-disulfide isomerase